MPTTEKAAGGLEGIRKPPEAHEEKQQVYHNSHGLHYHHPYAGSKGYEFYMPTRSFLGIGAMSRCGDEFMNNKQAYQKALVVTDKVLHKNGVTQSLEEMLHKTGVDFVIYDEVEPNPTIDQVEEGVRVFKEAYASFIISFGGGSPHDAAKAIGIVATNGGHIRDYEGVDKMHAPMPPLVAINTTAGTGSEVTRFTIVTDPERHTKMAIIDWRCTPSLAVNDPTLMTKMPKGLTAATGMDALTHAIEAYVSKSSFPVTDASALHAIRLISTWLRKAYDEPNNIEARDMMSNAEYLAGTAFNSAGLGLVHAMSHQLGGFYNFPHGVCNAVLLPAVEEYNAKYVPQLFIDIAKAMGEDPKEDADKAVKLVLARIKRLTREIGIPKNLKELGARPEDFPTLAANALKDACATSNPAPFTYEDVVNLYKKAYDQE